MSNVLIENAVCPFCGSDGEANERHNPMSKWRWSVDCAGTTCGMSGPVEATKADAWAAWNERHRTAGQAELVPEVRNALGEAMQAIEQIGIITAGCAQTHGDPGGGLEMANGYANDAFTLLAQVDAALAPLSQSKGEG